MAQDTGRASEGFRSVAGPLRIGLLGDRVPGYAKHDALQPAISAAAKAMGATVEIAWLPSECLARDAGGALDGYDGLVAAPQSLDYCAAPHGIKAALRHARREGTCCLAVCGGAQFALEEHADEIRGGAGGESILTLASCDPGAGPSTYALSGVRSVHLVQSNPMAAYFGTTETREHFACSYVLAHEAEELLAGGGVAVVGTTPGVGPTLFEWRDHRCYFAALFVPHWSEDQPHPLFALLLDRVRQQHG